MKTLFFCTLLFVLPQGAFAGVLADPTQMQFHYEPVEGEAATLCRHKQIRDLPDWDVVCETGYGKKTYSVHLIVREYPRAGATGVEILYWVSEPGETPTSPHKFHSTTALMHLKGESGLADILLSQGVENDFASLVLSWGGGAARTKK